MSHFLLALRHEYDGPGERNVTDAHRVIRIAENRVTDPKEMVSVRYMVDDVQEAVAFYTKFLDFRVLHQFPAFADVARGKLRLLLSGPASSAGRPMRDGAKPGPGGWNRIHLIVDDIDSEVARLWNAGARL